MKDNKEWLLFGIFIMAVILINSCRVTIEKTTIKLDEPNKVILEGHDYWVSGTNITHSASCPCGGKQQ
jgi:hypothetical protein